MSKILIHSIVFSPDGVSTAYLYNDLALKFKESGFEVAVLTTTPHYNIVNEELKNQPLKNKCLGLYYTSNYKGIQVKHIPQKKFKNSFLRMLGFIYWHIASFFLGLFERKVDIILSPSPPLTIGLVNIALAKLKGAKTIYNVQEIYPDLLIKEKGVRSNIIISAFKWLEKTVYNNSDAVTTIDEVFYSTIKSRFKDSSKLKVIPNFVDTEIYYPLKSKLVLNQEYFPDTDSLKVMYAGNIGFAQDWDTLISVAIKLKGENIKFFIIGEGVMKPVLKNEIQKHRLTNIHLIPYQPRELMPSLIAYSDIQFIFMSPQAEGHGFPSKVYTIMACAKPILVSSGESSPIVNFLKDKNCSYLITDSKKTLKVNKIVQLLQSANKQEFNKMGYAGLKEINKFYSKEIVTQKYVELINTLLH